MHAVAAVPSTPQAPMERTNRDMDTSLETPQYIYPPLDHATDDIRILHVLPNLSNGMIQISMRRERMPSVYSCLSYVWGDASDVHEILMNGHRVKVRRNLFNFLRTARLRFASIPLWIDALCINQANNSEKNHQVQRMGKIYANAEEVFIWLGMERELDGLLHPRTITTLCKNPPYWIYKGSPFHAQIFHLMCNEYWSRMWIVQEMLLAKDLFLVTGCRTVRWALVDEFINWELADDLFRNYYDEESIHYYRKLAASMQMVPVARLKQRWSDPARNAAISIWDHLAFVSTSKCSDIRDRIYGLLSLLEEGEEFRVDYTESIRSLYWRVKAHFERSPKYTSPDVLLRALGLTHSSLLGLEVPEHIGGNTAILNICRMFHFGPGVDAKDGNAKDTYDIAKWRHHPLKCSAASIQPAEKADSHFMFCLDESFFGISDMHALWYRPPGQDDYILELISPPTADEESRFLPRLLHVPSFVYGALYQCDPEAFWKKRADEWRLAREAPLFEEMQDYKYAVGLSVNWLIREVSRQYKRVQEEEAEAEAEAKAAEGLELLEPEWETTEDEMEEGVREGEGGGPESPLVHMLESLSTRETLVSA